MTDKWDKIFQERADNYYSLRVTYNKFLIDKSKLMKLEREGKI